MIYPNILKTIGNTPLIRINNLIENPKVTLLAKLEGTNPTGSVKDRPAHYITSKAERKGILTKEKTILEATSGNMGIALAAIGAQKGYKVVIVMSEVATPERRKILKSLGAELILTPTATGTTGAFQKAKEIYEKHPEKYFLVDQFNNPWNVEAHFHGAAKEILEEVKNIDVMIVASGTSGTLMGTAKRFRKNSPQTKIIGAFPEKGFQIPGLQNPHKDFIGKFFQEKLIDDYFIITEEESTKMVKKAAKKEGLFLGPSSGTALAAAAKIKEGLVVTILPDRGDKYLSTGIFN
ncbi:MAG: PLP-dependent cysteine synthase family protein [Patescibacteria group bacterium]|nr:PLP-dependent cysteine synthase family protein [Patescibacteria group bacterium]